MPATFGGMEQSLTTCLISAGRKHNQVNEGLNDGGHTHRLLFERESCKKWVQMHPLISLLTSHVLPCQPKDRVSAAAPLIPSSRRTERRRENPAGPLLFSTSCQSQAEPTHQALTKAVSLQELKFRAMDNNFLQE